VIRFLGNAIISWLLLFLHTTNRQLKNWRWEGLGMRLGDPGHPAVWLVHIQTSDHVILHPQHKLTQTLALTLPNYKGLFFVVDSKLQQPYHYFSPPFSHTTHSWTICHLSIQGAISTVFVNFFLGLLPLNSNKKVIEASSARYFWKPIQIRRSTGHCTCIFIVANPVLKPEDYRSPESASSQRNSACAS